MTKTTCTDQDQCRAVLRELVCEEAFKPTPPLTACDGILELADDLWLVGANDRGILTLHILEDCTKVEAFEFMKSLCGHTAVHVNQRPVLIGALPNDPQFS